MRCRGRKAQRPPSICRTGRDRSSTKFQRPHQGLHHARTLVLHPFRRLPRRMRSTRTCVAQVPISIEIVLAMRAGWRWPGWLRRCGPERRRRQKSAHVEQAFPNCLTALWRRSPLRRLDHLDRHSELLELRLELGRIADDHPGEALGIERARASPVGLGRRSPLCSAPAAAHNNPPAGASNRCA